MFKQMGGGVKGFLNNVKKKTALILHDGFLSAIIHTTQLQNDKTRLTSQAS